MKKFVVLIGVLSVSLLSACSSTSQYKGIYEKVETAPTLEVPPGLDSPDDSGAALPELGNKPRSYSEFTSTKTQRMGEGYLPVYKNMRFVREGSLFWVEVNDYPENVWPDVRNFFKKVGFKIAYEQPQVGLIQTDWKENKHDLPTGWIMSLIGGLYSAELMDSYRIRMEFDEEKVISRIFVAHRGLQEVVENEGNDNDIVKTKWVPRPPDGELEIEMLMRFMVFRGVDEQVARENVASSKVQQRVKIVKLDDTLVLEMDDTFARVWRHVGIALDRMGVLVEDRNRSAGVYYIKLPETFEIEDTTGLFSGLFTSTTKPSTDTYLLTVKESGNTTRVMVRPRGEVGKDLPLVTKKILDDLQGNIL